VRIEARVARNAELLALIGCGQLDLALAWDADKGLPYGRRITELPMCWIGRQGESIALRDEPLPLVAFEAPCLMRQTATAALDRAGIAWRLAFSSASLSGIWAAVAAGLGITIRTSIGLPGKLQVLTGMPELPSIGLLLHRAEAEPNAVVKQLETIILGKLGQLLPAR
jgi:DNA-binding transcriptional LysR family regulator